MYEFMIKFDFYQKKLSFCPIFREKKCLMSFRTEKFGPLSPNIPDFPDPKGSPGGNDTHETCMNEFEKCIYEFFQKTGFYITHLYSGFPGSYCTTHLHK
jgi:hypothetical protein